jgi:hypothetical protein
VETANAPAPPPHLEQARSGRRPQLGSLLLPRYSGRVARYEVMEMKGKGRRLVGSGSTDEVFAACDRG